MYNLSEVSYSTIKELILFLKFEDSEDDFIEITKRLTRFILIESTLEVIALENFVRDVLSDNSESENEYAALLKAYPELKFDEKGQLQPKKFDYYTVVLESCEELYKVSKDNEQHKKAKSFDKQVIYAKDLIPFKSIKANKYPVNVIYFKKNNTEISLETFNDMKKSLNKLLGSDNNISEKFIRFISSRKSSSKIFIDNFLSRLNCLEQDTELKYKENKEFLENLKKVN